MTHPHATKVRIVIRKKKGGHAAHHGGAWKVAYADFVTAMMALFIVLWLLTQADLETRSNIARYFRNPGVLSGGSTAGVEQPAVNPSVIDNRLAVVQQRQAIEEAARLSEQELLTGSQKRLEEMLSNLGDESPELAELAKLTQVRMTERGLEIEMVDSNGAILFESGSSALKPALVQLLKKVGALLGELPNDVEVSGHTDAEPFAAGSASDNWQLSFARAAAARPVLEEGGLRANQVHRILAHADSDLLITEAPEDPRNRRLSILAVRRSAPAASTMVGPPAPKTSTQSR